MPKSHHVIDPKRHVQGTMVHDIPYRRLCGRPGEEYLGILPNQRILYFAGY